VGVPAAAQGDQVVATDTHILLVPAPTGPTPVPLPHPFTGALDAGLCPTVRIAGRPAAVVGSAATNTPPHVPANPAAAFQRPPTNRGTVTAGSATVRFGGRPAARHGDPVTTCNDPADLPVGRLVVPGGTVNVG
jgi:uncharacterized Zn-binding protein involved in type VI secretion